MRSRAALFCLVICVSLVAGCDELDCDGDALFQAWTESAFTSADGGTAGAAPYLDLTLAHYGAGQDFHIGACTYLIDIESDDTGDNGVFSFSDANPDTPACIANEVTETWSLSCTALVVTGPRGTETFLPPSELPDAG